MAMSPARLFVTWEVFYKDFHAIKSTANYGNKRILTVVDRTGFLFAYPTQSKAAISIARILTHLCLTFGVVVAIHSDAL